MPKDLFVCFDLVHPLVAMVFTAQIVTASYKAQSLVNNEWTATLLRKEKHYCDFRYVH